LRPRELAHVLGHSRADGIFLVPEYRGTAMAESLGSVRGDLPALREVVSFADWEAFCSSGSPTERLPAVDPGDAAQIQYTSGTTGRPKGVVLNHRGIVNNARLYVDRIALDRGTVQLSPMPLFHTAGCVMSVLGAIANEGTLVLPPSFDPGLVLELVEAERVEHLLGVPTMLTALLDHPAFATTDTSSVRRLLSGGAVVLPGLVARAEAAFGAPLSIVFAQTEASPAITQTAPHDDAADRAMTLGRPLPQTEVKIVDFVSGATVGPDVIGELCTRGYHVMSGYFDDPAATAAAVDADGWLHTGDLASMDPRGYCRIGGRLKDMIIRGGENIYPREIEQVLFEHEDVADVTCWASPTPSWASRWPPSSGPRPGARPTPTSSSPTPRAARAVQAPAPLDDARRVAHDPVGQGAEVRPARAVPRRHGRPADESGRRAAPCAGDLTGLSPKAVPRPDGRPARPGTARTPRPAAPSRSRPRRRGRVRSPSAGRRSCRRPAAPRS
jgi:acyl-CoA synthetase (AMP-forming)/AMP-acid ligase II